MFILVPAIQPGFPFLQTPVECRSTITMFDPDHCNLYLHKMRLRLKSTSKIEMGVSENSGTPKSSLFLIGFSIINHPFWGFSPYFWKHTYMHFDVMMLLLSLYLRKRSLFVQSSWISVRWLFLKLFYYGSFWSMFKVHGLIGVDSSRDLVLSPKRLKVT